MTPERWDRACFQMGCSRAETQAMSLQEFLLRRQAFMMNQRNAARRSLMVVNTIIGLTDGDPVTLAELEGAAHEAEEEDPRKQEIQAMKGRYPSFVTDPEL